MLDDLELDPDRLPFSCDFQTRKLHVAKSPFGLLPGLFLPVPDSIAEEFCADGKWDPPDPGLSSHYS